MTAPRVVVVGGHSAGHIEPMMNFADALRRLEPTAEITALGTVRGLDTTLILARGYPLELIPPVPLPRKLNRALLQTPGRLRDSVRAAGRSRPRAGRSRGGLRRLRGRAGLPRRPPAGPADPSHSSWRPGGGGRESVGALSRRPRKRPAIWAASTWRSPAREAGPSRISSIGVSVMRNEATAVRAISRASFPAHHRAPMARVLPRCRDPMTVRPWRLSGSTPGVRRA